MDSAIPNTVGQFLAEAWPLDVWCAGWDCGRHVRLGPDALDRLRPALTLQQLRDALVCTGCGRRGPEWIAVRFCMSTFYRRFALQGGLVSLPTSQAEIDRLAELRRPIAGRPLLAGLEGLPEPPPNPARRRRRRRG